MSDNTLLNSGTGGDTVRDIDRSGVKTQVVALDFGGQAGPESLATITNALPVALSGVYYPISSANSSTAQLAPGQTFTGTAETILTLQAAQIEIICDQPYTFTVYQYIDAAGLQLSSTDTFTRAGGVPYNENITLPGNYFKLSVTNLGFATTTKLVINTTFGIMATGPRTLTALGNNRSAINEIGGIALNAGTQSAAASIPVTQALDGMDDPVSLFETMQAILNELRVMNTILHSTLNCRDDLDALRYDSMQLGNSTNPIQ